MALVGMEDQVEMQDRTFDLVKLGAYDNVSGEYGIYYQDGQKQFMALWTASRKNPLSPTDRDDLVREIVRRWNQQPSIDVLVSAAKAALYMVPQGQPEYGMLEDALEPWFQEDKARIREKAEQARKERGYDGHIT